MRKSLFAAAVLVVLACSVLVAQVSRSPYSIGHSISMAPQGKILSSRAKFENAQVVITASELTFDPVTNEINASGDVKVTLKKN